MTQPVRGLKAALSLPQRIQIHKFIERPDEAVVDDTAHYESCRVSMNEVTEIYLALRGDLPEKLPFREHFGFDAAAVIDALDSADGKNRIPRDQYPADINEAARLADALLDSICFKHYSGRVALKTGMLSLKRAGYAFHGDALEETWPEGNDYRRIREWFGRVSVKVGTG
jgi:hypothetical protein